MPVRGPGLCRLSLKDGISSARSAEGGIKKIPQELKGDDVSL